MSAPPARHIIARYTNAVLIHIYGETQTKKVERVGAQLFSIGTLQFLFQMMLVCLLVRSV